MLFNCIILGWGDTTYATLDWGGAFKGVSTFVWCDKSCKIVADRQPSICRRGWADRSGADRNVVGEVRIFQSRSIERLEISKVWSNGAAFTVWWYRLRSRRFALGIGMQLCRTSIRRFVLTNGCIREWVRSFFRARRSFPETKWVSNDSWINGTESLNRVGD